MLLGPERRRNTLTECFAHFGVPRAGNVRQWWSGKSPGGTVVITLWVDHFKDVDFRKFSIFDRADLPVWKDKKANRDRCKLLQEVGVGGVFQSIVQVPGDSSAEPRKIIERYIGNPMRLTDLNPATGEFSAEAID